MFNLWSLTKPMYIAEDGAGGTPATPQEPAAVQPPAVAGQEPGKVAEETFDWFKDERYGKMWKGDDDVAKYVTANPKAKAFIDNVYKSYRNIEKVHEPLKTEAAGYKKQVDTLNALSKEFGITPEQLKDVLTEHKTFKDPGNPSNVLLGYVNGYLQDPVYKPRLEKFFNDLDDEKLKVKYPNMNEEQIRKMVELEEKVKSLEETDKKSKHEGYVKQFEGNIVQAKEKISKLCQSHGYAFDDTKWTEFLKHCNDNEIEPRYMYQEFRDKYGEDIDKLYADKVKSETLQSLNKNKDSTIIPGKAGGGMPAATEGGTLRDRLSKVADGLGFK